MADQTYEVNSGSGVPSQGSPCERLAPIVEALLAAGNVPNTNGFVTRPDGLVFALVYPIDFKLVRETCDVPRGVVLGDESDTILDRLTWCSIEGPGAMAADVVG